MFRNNSKSRVNAKGDQESFLLESFANGEKGQREWEEEEEEYSINNNKNNSGKNASGLKGCCRQTFIDNSQRSVQASIYFMVFICLLGSIGYSITIPSVWGYLNILGSYDETMIGFNIGIYCLGQFISANFFGWLANRFSMSVIVAICLALDLIGQCIYAFATDSWFLLVSRLVSGLGAGTVTLGRGYVSSCVPADRRLGAMSWISAAQALGFVAGAALGAGLSLICFNIGPYIVVN